MPRQLDQGGRDAVLRLDAMARSTETGTWVKIRS
jgi:hypothetical protein